MEGVFTQHDGMDHTDRLSETSLFALLVGPAPCIMVFWRVSHGVKGGLCLKQVSFVDFSRIWLWDKVIGSKVQLWPPPQNSNPCPMQ